MPAAVAPVAVASARGGLPSRPLQAAALLLLSALSLPSAHAALKLRTHHRHHEHQASANPTVGRMAVPYTNYTLSRIAYGGLHWPDFKGDVKLLSKVVDKALSLGITTMDLADVYGWYQDGHGRSNDLFAKLLKQKPHLRNKMELVCKFGIRLHGGYHVDTSPGWIHSSIDHYLTLFNTTHCDVFVIHNPHPDMDNDEVAQTFREIYDQGKALMFGVSNFHEWEYKPLKEAMEKQGLRLSVHEFETSVLHPDKITDGTLDFSHKDEMVILGWGPVGGDPYGGKNLLFASNGTREKEIVRELKVKGKEVKAHADQVCVSWLLAHPANIVPILGTTRPDRLHSQSIGAQKVRFLPEDYQEVLIALPPEAPAAEASKALSPSTRA